MSIEAALALEQYSPSQWRAKVDYDSWSAKPDTSQVFIHWTGMPCPEKVESGNITAEKALIRRLEADHLKRGWSGLAYDWVIGQSGKLYRVRGLARSAATSGDVDRDGFSNNLEGEAICFLTGTKGEVSEKALATAAELLKVIDYGEVHTHSGAGGTPTSCPGPELTQWVKGRGWEEKEEKAPPKKTIKKKKKTPAATTDWTEELMSSLGVHKKGDRGSRVMKIQALLNLHRHGLKVDGLFGPQTEKAVYEFQHASGLARDGIVGRKTWSALLLR